MRIREGGERMREDRLSQERLRDNPEPGFLVAPDVLCDPGDFVEPGEDPLDLVNSFDT